MFRNSCLHVDDDDDGKTYVRMLRTVLSPTNCGDTRLSILG